MTAGAEEQPHMTGLCRKNNDRIGLVDLALVVEHIVTVAVTVEVEVALACSLAVVEGRENSWLTLTQIGLSSSA